MNQSDATQRGQARVSSLFNADSELAKVPGIANLPKEQRPSVREQPPSPEEVQKSLGELCTHRDCHRNAQMSAGSLSDDRENPVIRVQGVEQSAASIDDPRQVGGLKQTATHRGALAVFLTTFEAFPAVVAAAIADGRVEANQRAAVEGLAEACRNLGTTLAQVKEASVKQRRETWGEGSRTPLVHSLWELYQRIYDNPTAIALYSEAFGVNDRMRPRVGDMLTTINKDTEAGRERTIGDKNYEMWNFHYTGVLMTDGDDYVVLEDFAGDYSQGALETGHWFFRMYGPRQQSFWSTYSPDKDVHTGTSPLAVIMRPTPQGQQPFKR
jgi:hypothetical protein